MDHGSWPRRRAETAEARQPGQHSPGLIWATSNVPRAILVFWNLPALAVRSTRYGTPEVALGSRLPIVYAAVVLVADCVLPPMQSGICSGSGMSVGVVPEQRSASRRRALRRDYV